MFKKPSETRIQDEHQLTENRISITWQSDNRVNDLRGRVNLIPEMRRAFTITSKKQSHHTTDTSLANEQGRLAVSQDHCPSRQKKRSDPFQVAMVFIVFALRTMHCRLPQSTSSINPLEELCTNCIFEHFKCRKAWPAKK